MDRKRKALILASRGLKDSFLLVASWMTGLLAIRLPVVEVAELPLVVSTIQAVTLRDAPSVTDNL